jgi:hypothetical protein
MQCHYDTQFKTVNNNICMIAIQPPRMANAQQQNQQLEINQHDEMTLVAELSKTPKTLNGLWTEYHYGIGGLKPAKDFTPSERGRCKKTYSQRKAVWDSID